MIFAGSRIWHEGTATDLSVMTEEIKKSFFTGHIVLEFQESLDLVIVSHGEFVKVIEKIGRRIMTTKKYREIWGKCQIKQGRMMVFELPPPLAARLKGMGPRRLVASEDVRGCDIAGPIREQKAAGLTGFIDGSCPEGRGILEMENGIITSCYFTEFYGLAYRGLEAFRIWHGYLQGAAGSSTLWVSEYREGTDNSHLWDAILTEKMESVKVPLPTSEERLSSAFGQMVFEGETLFTEGEDLDRAYYIIEGSIELSRRFGSKKIILGYYGPGTILGLSWLNGMMPPPMTGTSATNCRLLTFDRAQLEHILVNSPALAAELIGRTTAQLQGVRQRKELFAASPRLRDLESSVFRVLNDEPSRLKEGLPPGDLFRELSQIVPFSLPEMDQMVRQLVSAGRIELSGGRVLLRPEEI